MRRKLVAVILVLIVILGGCSKSKINRSYQLDFTEVNKEKLNDLDLNNINEIVEEERFDNGSSVFLFRDDEGGEIKSGISINNKSYFIGVVSIENTPLELTGIKKVQVFGKDALKIYGILGTNYAHAYYWFPQEDISTIHIEGHTVEIDLDDDGKNEIVSNSGTIPEANIYIFKEDKIYISDVAKSIGAKSVRLLDEEKKIFEVYFKPNKPEVFTYYNGSLLKI